MITLVENWNKQELNQVIERRFFALGDFHRLWRQDGAISERVWREDGVYCWYKRDMGKFGDVPTVIATKYFNTFVDLISFLDENSN